MKWSLTLTDRLGPEMLTVLEIKGQVLHRVRLHVKIPGLLLNLNALLTKKLPKFLSRLNEMSGGKENMCLVSGSLLRILKFLRMTFLIARLCDFNNKCEEMRQFFKKRGYPDSAVTTGKHHAQEIDRETALQTSQNEETDRIPFTLTYHPQNKVSAN